VDSDENECSCPSDDDGFDMVLQEQTAGEDYMKYKQCVQCQDNTAVITSDATIAGVDYYANDYDCQRCPSPHMSFDSSGSSCSCDSDYTMTGQSSLGPQSCLYTTHYDEITSDYDPDDASEVIYRWVSAFSASHVA